MQYTDYSAISRRDRAVMSTGLRVIDTTFQFNTSDSRIVIRSLLGNYSSQIVNSRTGSNGQNTSWVRGAGTVVCQASRLLKTDGAGHTEAQAEETMATEYFRVTGGVS